MTTISVSLDDETYARLKAAADADHTSVEAMLSEAAAELAGAVDEAAAASSMATRHMRRYPLLFERLSK